MKPLLTKDQALHMAVENAPSSAKTARVSYEGISHYDVDMEKRYVYSAGRIQQVDFYVNGGHRRLVRREVKFDAFNIAVLAVTLVFALSVALTAALLHLLKYVGGNV